MTDPVFLAVTVECQHCGSRWEGHSTTIQVPDCPPSCPQYRAVVISGEWLEDVPPNLLDPFKSP